MNTQIVIDNSNNKRKVYKNLPIGTKLKAKKTTIGKLDVGMSGIVIDYEDIIAGKEYEISYISKWGFQEVPCVHDEDNCIQWAEVSLFDII